MGIFEKLTSRRREFNSKQQDFEDVDRIQRDIERRKLSHNEREAISILIREKEEALKEALKLEQTLQKRRDLLKTRSFFKEGNFNLLE